MNLQSTDLKTQCIHHEDMQLVNVTRHVTKKIENILPPAKKKHQQGLNGTLMHNAITCDLQEHKLQQ